MSFFILFRKAVSQLQIIVLIGLLSVPVVTQHHEVNQCNLTLCEMTLLKHNSLIYWTAFVVHGFVAQGQLQHLQESQ